MFISLVFLYTYIVRNQCLLWYVEVSYVFVGASTIREHAILKMRMYYYYVWEVRYIVKDNYIEYALK